MTERQEERSVKLSNDTELLWNDEERILFVRYSENGIPLLSSPEVEIDIVLDTLEKAQSEVERLTAENAEKDAAIKVWEKKYEASVQIGDANAEEASRLRKALEEAKERHNSFLTVVREATEFMSWRDQGDGSGCETALKLVYKWLVDNPSPQGQAHE